MKFRFNGTGPAWPRLLGKVHPFYTPATSASLGSTSYSILDDNDDWEILIDAGHNTIPFLLQNGNRIPNAVIFTHGHADHILGFDWLVQSQRFTQNDLKLPVYCTSLVFDRLMNSYEHCRDYIEFRELIPGNKTYIPEASDLELMPLPVYHGQSALGATSLYIKNSGQSIFLSGDMLCPLFRKKDFEIVSSADLFIVDTNNRYSNPQTNHISLSPYEPTSNKRSVLLSKWLDDIKISTLLKPHLSDKSRPEIRNYFNEFQMDWSSVEEIPFSILDLLKLTKTRKVFLVHYSGIFDELNYNQDFMNADELSRWANKTAKKNGILHSKFFVPKVGELIAI